MKRIAISACLLLSHMAYAQESAITLPGVEIIARGDLASTIQRKTTLGQDTLTTARKRDFNELLRGQPGVTLQAPNRGASLSSVWLRGTSSGLGQFTLDGVPLFSTLAGAFNLSSLLPAAMERVEILRGPTAARYGSPALGGVIRLFSREAEHSGGFIQAEGGSFASVSESIGLDLAGKSHQLAITVSQDNIFQGYSQADPANGNMERDGMRSSQGLLHVSTASKQGLALDGTVFFSRTRLNIDGPGLLADGRIGLRDDPTAFAIDETWLAQGTAEWELASRWQSRLQLGFTRNDRHGQIRTQPFGFTSRLLLANWVNTTGFLADLPNQHFLGLRWGMEARQEQGENQFDLPGLTLRGTRTHLAGFAEFQSRWRNWQEYLGVRAEYYDNFETRPTLNGGISWQATPALKLRASGGTVYRAPSFHERFFIPLFGNPLLQAERGWQADFGFEWVPNEAGRLTVSGFYSEYRELIQTVFNLASPALIGTENVAKARIQGMEIEASYRWNKSLKMGADYTYTGSENLNTQNMLPLRSRHQGRIYGEYQFTQVPLLVWTEAVYRGSHFDDSANRLKELGAVYVNAQIVYRVKPGLSVYVRGENLTNDHTPQLFSFGTRGAGIFGGMRWDLR